MNIKLLVNPTAGHGRAERGIGDAVAYLVKHGAEVDVLESRSAQHMVQLAAEASRDHHDRLVICGGDGSVNLALRDLDLERAVIGVIPLGSCDDFARVLSIPRGLEAACEVILRGDVREVDVAVVNGNRFVGIAGFGFDSDVTKFANERVKHLRGTALYLYSMMRVLPKFKPRRVIVRYDGIEREEELMFAVVANSPEYGGGIRIAPHAVLDDGRLEMYLIKRCSKLDLLMTLPAAYTGKHVNSPFVEHVSGTAFSFESESPLDVYADGDYQSQTPVAFEMEKQRLKVMVPRK